jgi:dTMP kinase
MNKGVLISFEGGEGAGKTVQIKLLRDRLTREGKDVVVLREPGGTTVSEQIREIVLNRSNVGIAYTTEVLLFQAARAQIYREIVLPSLAAGKWVLMDRTRDSSVVYQGIVRGFGVEMIEHLNSISTKDTYPDVTILLDVPVEVGLARRNGTEEVNRMDIEQHDFHEQVRQAYLDLAKGNDRGRWVKVEATLDIDAVAHEVWERVREKLKI